MLGPFSCQARSRRTAPSLTGWTLFLRVSASLNLIIDFFNAGSNSGLLRLEHRFTEDLRKSAPWIDYPVPPRRRAFLHVKFRLAIPQESSSLSGQSTPNAPSPTTMPPFRFRSAGESLPVEVWRRRISGWLC